jgi:hypothetical protein
MSSAVWQEIRERFSWDDKGEGDASIEASRERIEETAVHHPQHRIRVEAPSSLCHPKPGTMIGRPTPRVVRV